MIQLKNNLYRYVVGLSDNKFDFYKEDFRLKIL